MEASSKRERMKKAERLLKFGRVKLDMKSGSRFYFTVKGEHEIHDVIIDLANKRSSCTCMFWTMKQEKCSHILACELYLKKMRKKA